MDEGSDSKAPRRKRVSRACDRCRSKKDKCDGIRPSCSACQASGQTCSYDPHAKKRGLPEGYVRGLEKLWALSLCNVDGLEDTILTMLGTTAESAGRRNKIMKLWTDESASESLHESWKTSRLFGALEKMLSNSDGTPAATGKRPRDDNQIFGAGAEGEWGFRVTRSSSPLGADAPRVVEPDGSLSHHKRVRLSAPSNSRTVAHTAGSSRPLHLPAQTSQLLDIYFSITHSWFPIVAKHNVLRASYLYANAGFSVANASPGSGDHAALWAILSYTIAQSRGTPVDGMPGMLSETEYYSVARKLIPSEKERYELGHVQALLLLTLVNIGLEDWTAAWLLSGQAVRMAIAMELGTFSDTRPSEELRQGKAVFLGCFVIDSLLSFRLSRSPCMRPKDLATVGLLEEDGLEEWNSWADVLPQTGAAPGKNPPRRGPLLALSCFNRLVELASVLNKLARDSSAGPDGHTFAHQLVQELKQWDDRLPLGCRLIGPDSIFPERHSALLPHQSYLCLTYIATLMWLYLRLSTREQNLRRSQRPAVEGAKKLLFRTLPMLSQHLENFKVCGLPPIFEFALRTIAEQAFTLRKRIKPDTFPFLRWSEALLQKTGELSSSWPVYKSLNVTIDRWKQPNGLSESSSVAFETPVMDTLRFAHGSSNRWAGDPVALAATGQRGPESDLPIHHRPGPGSLLSDNTDSEYTSSIMGITIPADGQYMTPKDSAMENVDIPVMDTSLQQPIDGSSTFSDKFASRNLSETVVPPATHPHPPTPESAASNNMNPGAAATGESLMLRTESLDAPGEIDAIFKDLAYLDTTEWATTREAGLKDLSFIDDRTFQAFCNDPDRLAGSQPLVHPPSIADIWPPPGFFPETFQESPEETEVVSTR